MAVIFVFMEEIVLKASTMIKYMILGLIAYLAPLKAELLLVITLAVFDWITGLLKGIKGEINNIEGQEFTSRKAVQKVFVILVYIIMLFSVYNVEKYLGISQYIVRTIVCGITIAELQSLRENIQILTGIDFFKETIKIVPNYFKKR